MSGARPPDRMLKFVVEPDGGGRLDRVLRRWLPGISRGSIHRLIERGQVLVDGAPRPKGTWVETGQRIVVAIASADERPVPQPELSLTVIAERDDFIVVDKPAGIPSHPLVPGETDTVANAIAARYPQCVSSSARAREGGLVHRLDWSTSGVLVAARTAPGYGRLRGLFSSGRVLKEYLALVDGTLSVAGEIRGAVESQPGDRRRVRVVAPDRSGGQPAVTRVLPLVQVWWSGRAYTLVRAISHTGRRHQIRVHLAHAGHPLVGDDLYEGPRIDGVEGALLHAAAIEFDSERFEAPLPAVRADLLHSLGCDPGRLGIFEPARPRRD